MDEPERGTPLPEAAQRLGVSTDVIRKRIASGKLQAHKIGGRWYVLLHGSSDLSSQARNGSSQTGNGSSHTGFSTGTKLDDVQIETGTGTVALYERQIMSLETQLGFLKAQIAVKDEQLAAKDDQLRANQVIISQLAERTRALPVPQSQEPAEPSAHAADMVQPWWKRLFGLR
jgi:hypothetical protein